MQIIQTFCTIVITDHLIDLNVKFFFIFEFVMFKTQKHILRLRCVEEKNLKCKWLNI